MQQKGTKDNPYTSDEAYSLIDEGAFKGGYVIDSNGLVSYWLSEAEVVAYNSLAKMSLYRYMTSIAYSMKSFGEVTMIPIGILLERMHHLLVSHMQIGRLQALSVR